MQYFTRVLGSRNFILILAITLGLLVGEYVARFTQPAVLPLLALAMTLSAMNVKSRDFLSLRSMPQTIAYSLLLNYVVLGGLLLLLAYWLIDDNEIWIGFVLLASVPPAVAVAPFGHSLGGNTRFALVGMLGCYLAAIAIIPVSMLIFLGVEYFDPIRLLIILGELVVAPILLSRILLFVGAARHIGPWQGTILNWSFFFVIFTLIGLNRQAFFGEFEVVIKICVIAFATTFVLGYLIELVSKDVGVKYDTTISVILMGTLKNYGLAGGILLSLFSERSAIPPSVCVMFGVLIVVWLGFHFRKLQSQQKE
jgi:BASS family bile acid:Na+ symporter